MSVLPKLSKFSIKTKPSKVVTNFFFRRNVLLILLNLLFLFPYSTALIKNKFEKKKDATGDILEKIIQFELQEEEFQKANKTGKEKKFDEIRIQNIKNDFTSLRLENIIHNNTNFDHFTIQLAKYFLKLSSYSYCTEEQMKSQTCCPEIFTEDDWQLIEEKKVSYDDYNYAILASNKYKKIVVTFPGTRGPAQLIKELYYSNGVVFHEDPSEKIMSYLKTVYTLFKEDLEKTLEELFLKYNNYQFIFTGHSLGGSMAAISLLNSLKYGQAKSLTDSPILFTFGQPRVGNDVFANEIMKWIPIIYRVTRYGDIVTNVPFCSWIFSDNYQLSCYGILPEYKFDKNFILDDLKKKASESHFYTWHTGGWKHFTDDMSVYEDCGEELGENFLNEKCHLSLNLDISKHVQYFGLKVSDICQPIQKK